MGFKTIEQYTEEKDKGFFVLRNDRDSAKVIFLYRSPTPCFAPALSRIAR